MTSEDDKSFYTSTPLWEPSSSSEATYFDGILVSCENREYELPSAVQDACFNREKPSPSVELLNQTDSVDSEAEQDGWKKVSYFDHSKGTSITEITSEMLQKPRISSGQMSQRASTINTDSNMPFVESVSRDKVEKSEQEAHGRYGKTMHGRKNEEEDGNGKSSTSFQYDFVESHKKSGSNSSGDYDETDFAFEEKFMYIDGGISSTPDCHNHTATVEDVELLDAERKSQGAVNPNWMKNKIETRDDDILECSFDKFDNEISDTCTKSVHSVWHQSEFNRRNVSDSIFASAPVNETKIKMYESSTLEGPDFMSNRTKTEYAPGPLRLTGSQKSSFLDDKSNSPFGSSSSFPASSFPTSRAYCDNVNNSANHKNVDSKIGISALERCGGSGGWMDRHNYTRDSSPEYAGPSEADRELGELHTKSFGMTVASEDMDYDDFHPTMPDKYISQRQAITSYGSNYLNHHEESAHAIPSEKLKVMLTRKERKLQKQAEGVIIAGQIEGNKGNMPIEELMNFINNDKTNYKRNKKTSNKPKKPQQLDENASEDELKKMKVNDESHVKASEDIIEIHHDNKPVTKETLEIVKDSVDNDGTTVEVLTKTHGKEGLSNDGTTEGLTKPHGKEGLSNDGTTEVLTKPHGKEGLSNDGTTEGLTKPHGKEGLSIIKPSSHDLKNLPAITTGDSEKIDDFTVVQKKKRSRLISAEPAHNANNKKAEEKAMDFMGFKGPNKNLFSVSSAKHELARDGGKLNTGYVFRPTFKERMRKADRQVNSEDNSETSSTCSVPAVKQSPFPGVTAGDNIANHRTAQALRRNSDTTVHFHTEDTSQLCNTFHSPHFSNAGSPCDFKPAGTYKHTTLPQKTINVSDKQDIHADVDSGIDKTQSKSSDKCSVDISHDQGAQVVSSCQPKVKSSSYLANGLTRMSLGKTSRSVVFFDTREKSSRVPGAKDVDISFGFDPETDVGAAKANCSGTDSTKASIPVVMPYSTYCKPSSRLGLDFVNHNAIVDINYNHQNLQGHANKSSVAAVSNHGLPTNVVNPSLMYTFTHSLPPPGMSGYLVPVGLPVGIVPPIMMCDNKPPADVILGNAYDNKEKLSFLTTSPNVVSGQSGSSNDDPEMTCEKENTHLCKEEGKVIEEPPSVNCCFSKGANREGRVGAFNLSAAQAFVYRGFQRVLSQGSEATWFVDDRSNIAAVQP